MKRLAWKCEPLDLTGSSVTLASAPAMVIVADDLSGAADCGIACVHQGLTAITIFGNTSGTLPVDVLCIDANTRHMTQVQAVAETRRLLRQYASPGTVIYKKLDSTLRGHVHAEIAAALAALQDFTSKRPFAIVAPAYPQTGRTMRDGRQYLDGVPVEQTALWKDETGAAYLPAMLAVNDLRVAHAPIGAVRQLTALARVMADARATQDALVCDAETEDDLAAIARVGRELGTGVLWAGSGGLARHLPVAYGFAKSRHAFEVPPVIGPLLFAVGSGSRISHDQADSLAADRAVTALTVPAMALDGGSGGERATEARAQLQAALTSGGDLLVRLGAEGTPMTGTELCTAFAQLLSPLAACCGGLFLTGGETAHALMQTLRVTGLTLLGEIEPGVTLSLAQGGPLNNCPIVIKAGAFGVPSTMRHCRDRLRAGIAI